MLTPEQRKLIRDAERDSTGSILREMEERGYSVEAQRRVVDAALKHDRRYDTSCEYAVEAHGATICGSCWWCRGEW